MFRTALSGFDGIPWSIRVPGGECKRRVLIRGFVWVAVRMNLEFVLTGSADERPSCTRDGGGVFNATQPSLLTLIDCIYSQFVYRHSCVQNASVLVCRKLSVLSRARGTVKSSSACFVMQMKCSSC